MPLATNKSWPFYNVALSSLIAIAVIPMEVSLMSIVLHTITDTFGSATGAFPLVGTYFSLFIFGLLFQLVGSYSAYKSDNTMTVLAVSLFNLLTVGYSIIQMFQTTKVTECLSSLKAAIQTNQSIDTIYAQQEFCYYDVIQNNTFIIPSQTLVSKITLNEWSFNPIRNLSISIIVFMVFFNLIGFYVAFQAWKEYGWNNVLKQGASMEKQKMFNHYRLFDILLKLNVFFFLGTVAQYMAMLYFDSKSAKSQLNFYIALLAVSFCSVFYYSVGRIAVSHTKRWLMYIFILLMVISICTSSFLISKAMGDRRFQPAKIFLTSYGIPK
jgi:hypothetical protein